MIKQKNITGYNKSLSKLANINSMNFYSFAILYSPYIPKSAFKLFTIRPIFNILILKIFDRVFANITRLGILINKRLHFSKNVIDR